MSTLMHCCPSCDEQLDWLYDSALDNDHEPGARILRKGTVALILKTKLLDCATN